MMDHHEQDEQESKERAADQGKSRPTLGRLALLFLRIGATGFGGMMPLLALVHHYVIERHRLVDDEEFSEAMAVGQVLPGPIVVDTVTHVGYTVRGGLGAFVATASLLLPPTIIVVLLSPLYFAHENTDYLRSALRGIEAAVVGLILVATWRIARPAIKGWLAGFIAAGSFAALAFTSLHPVFVVLIAGVIGMIGLRPRPQADREGEGEEG